MADDRGPGPGGSSIPNIDDPLDATPRANQYSSMAVANFSYYPGSEPAPLSASTPGYALPSLEQPQPVYNNHSINPPVRLPESSARLTRLNLPGSHGAPYAQVFVPGNPDLVNYWGGATGVSQADPFRYPSHPRPHPHPARASKMTMHFYNHFYDRKNQDRDPNYRGRTEDVYHDTDSQVNYMSPCVAREIGADLKEYPLTTKFATSIGLFNPRYFIRIGLHCDNRGIDIKNADGSAKQWLFYLTPEILGRVDPTLGSHSIHTLQSSCPIYKHDYAKMESFLRQSGLLSPSATLSRGAAAAAPEPLSSRAWPMSAHPVPISSGNHLTQVLAPQHMHGSVPSVTWNESIDAHGPSGPPHLSLVSTASSSYQTPCTSTGFIQQDHMEVTPKAQQLDLPDFAQSTTGSEPSQGNESPPQIRGNYPPYQSQNLSSWYETT